MTLDAVVEEVGRALGDARRLYGVAPVAEQWVSTGGLISVRDAVQRTQREAEQFWQGTGGGAYAPAAGGKVRAADVVIEGDEGTGPGFTEGAIQGQQGRDGIDGVISTTQSGTAALAPSMGTPAGQRALLAHLKGQLSDAKTLLQESQQRDRQLATVLRNASAGYRGQPMNFIPPSLGGRASGGSSSLGGSPMGAGSSHFGSSIGHRRGGARRGEPPLHLSASAQGPAPDRVRAAIRKALDIKGIRDPAARARWESGMMLVAQRESGFRSDQVNRSDVNAQRGDPSTGTFQFIGSTFRANHEPGTSTVQTDDLAQACAFINYAQRHYRVAADGANLAANIQQADPTRAPHGY